MQTTTEKLWAKQNQHEGDRLRLFTAIASKVPAKSVFYPGCFVDISPSFVFPAVTYLDLDKRAARFFRDNEGVYKIVAKNRKTSSKPFIKFVHADYTKSFDLQTRRFDLLVSLYAGFISEYCTDYLKIGGMLLANASHGDAAMASIDPRYHLSAVVISSKGDYKVCESNLDRYLIPKKPVEITKALLHHRQRGIAYTKPAFAYLFKRIK